MVKNDGNLEVFPDSPVPSTTSTAYGYAWGCLQPHCYDLHIMASLLCFQLSVSAVMELFCYLCTSTCM